MCGFGGFGEEVEGGFFEVNLFGKVGEGALFDSIGSGGFEEFGGIFFGEEGAIFKKREDFQGGFVVEFLEREIPIGFQEKIGGGGRMILDPAEEEETSGTLGEVKSCSLLFMVGGKVTPVSAEDELENFMSFGLDGGTG